MIEKQNTYLTALYKSYESSPALKSLIQLVNYSGLPIGPMIDSALGAYVNRIKAERLRIFFDELYRGDIVLTEEEIESNDFLHAYFETAEYVLRTKSDEKIKRFAKILKKVYSGDLKIEDFEYYTSLFNELTDKEFAILAIKYEYEQDNKNKTVDLINLQVTHKYWESFKKDVVSKLEIKESEVNLFLIRLQRTV